LFIACATVGLAELASANVVGYQSVEASGYKMVLPTFSPVGGGEYNLDNFSVIGVGDMGATIQIMDADGKWIGMYSWYNEYTDPDTGDYYPAGWLDENNNPAGTIKAGYGVYYYSAVAGAKVQSSGEVSGDVTIDVPVGYSMIGNATPVAINADVMEVIGVDDMGATIQTMNAAGKWIGMYSWYNEYTDPDTGDYYPAGWLDEDGNSAGTLNSGDAVYFYTATSGVKVKVPSALK
jgi:hypothetical protein